MTVLIQLEVIREKGHWVAGGNLAFPVLLAILLWWPSYLKNGNRKEWDYGNRKSKGNIS